MPSDSPIQPRPPRPIALLILLLGTVLAGATAGCRRASRHGPAASWTLLSLADRIPRSAPPPVWGVLDPLDPAARPALLEGWLHPSGGPLPPGFVWLEGTSATLAWNLPGKDVLDLSLDVQPRILRGRRPWMEAVWNDVPLGRRALHAGDQTVRFRVPRKATRAGANLLRLTTAYAMRVREARILDARVGMEDAWPWLVEGWSENTVAILGQTMRWLDGSEAAVEFQYEGPAHPCVLSLIAAVLPAANRRLAVRLNDVELGVVDQGPQVGKVLKVPGGLLRSGSNELRFVVDPPLSEADQRRAPGPALVGRVVLRATDVVSAGPKTSLGLSRVEVHSRGLTPDARTFVAHSSAPPRPAIAREGSAIILRPGAVVSLDLASPAGASLEAEVAAVGPAEGKIELAVQQRRVGEASPERVAAWSLSGGEQTSIHVPLAGIPGVTVPRRDGREGDAVPPSVLATLILVTHDLEGPPVELHLRGARVVVEGVPRPPRPNIILVVIDTLRADHLQPYGYARATSPAVAALASESAVFDRAHSTSTWTLPSMISLLGGLWPEAFAPPREGLPGEKPLAQTTRLRIGEASTTLAERLAAWGYATAAFVDVPYLRPEAGFAQGFQVFNQEASAIPAEDPSGGAALVFRRGLEWLDRKDAREPFFLFLHAFDVHVPYLPPPPYDTLFDDAALQNPTEIPIAASSKAIGSIPAPAAQGSMHRLAHYVAQYDREIRRTDDLLGDLIAELRRRGLFEDSLFIFTADHGEAFGEGGLYCDHGLAVEPVARVPLLWKPPGGIPGGRRIDAPVQHIDVTASILDTALRREPRDLDGRSFLPLLDGSPPAASSSSPPREGALSSSPGAAPPPPRDALFVEGGLCWQQAIYEGRWKLWRLAPGLEAMEETWRSHPLSDPDDRRKVIVQLFDMREDPGATHDVSEEHPEVVARMLSRLDTWMASVQREAANRQGAGAKPQAPAPSFDEEDLEELRRLGYVK